MRGAVRLGGLATALLMACAAPAMPMDEGKAPGPRAPLSAITEHQGFFGDETVRYRAEVAETFVPGAGGKPAGVVVTISYLRRDADAATRPVIFLFNGGPGASTTPFHFDFFGPQRRLGEGDAQWMAGNPDSPLDSTDLVFIDPVGTGYSRPLPGRDGRQFWSRTSDAASVAFVIREWLRRHGREDSPRYLAGQSYGTVRAATMLMDAVDLEFDGVLLFALVANAEGSEMPQVVALPTMAAIAWYHERIARNGRSVEQVFDEAVEFARGEYVTALIRGASLPAKELHAVAARMAALTGLPADYIAERRLRVSKEDFYLTLLQDQGLRTGQLDGRATARLDAPKQRPPYDDPGISYTPDPPPPVPEQTRSTAPGDESALERYFREALRFRSAERYIALNLDVNQAWKPEGAWGDGTPFQATDAIAAAMLARPKMRLFWVSGLYDLSTPAYAGRYALDRAGVPADRLTAVRLPGGHSVYKDEANRRALAGAVRRFVTATSAAPAAGEPAPRAFVTRHAGVFNGIELGYTATVGEFIQRDGGGGAIARLFVTSYVRDTAAGSDSRPVLFLWNGGPGAASLWLHVGAFGPRRAELPQDPDAEIAPPYRLVPNPHSLLDVADLVFVDPVGTGFSRLVDQSKLKEIYTPVGDAKSVAELIRAWVRTHGRERSPLYALGESYGTIRAVLVADELARDLPLEGIYLFGQGVNLVETTQRAGNIVGYATNLPALAAIAWYHGRAHPRYRDVSRLIEEAWRFGMKDYLLALARGDALSEAERRRIARRLAEMTGLPAQYYLDNGLVITKQRFRGEILKDRGLVVGFYDGRYTAPAAAEGEPMPDPSMKIRDPFVTLAREQYAGSLAVTLEDEYRPGDPAAARFDWGAPAHPFSDYDFAGVLSRLMRSQDCLRLAIGTGIYDTTTTVGPARYLVARSALPRERVAMFEYEGGHMAYSNEAALAAMAQDVRGWLSGPKCPQQ